MLNRKWIARSCFSLSILSMFMLSVCAQETPLAQSCPSDDSSQTHESNLRRQIESQPPPLTINSNAKIASINLKQLNVFNTELEAENNALFRFANRAHIQTEPEVIKSILLFKAGDTFNQKTLAESERLLRKQNYLYDAQIIADENCDGNIDVTVITRDLWTLLPELKQ